MKTRVLIITAFTIFFTLKLFCQTWKFVGGPEGGNVRCFAVDSSGNIYTGLSFGGVYTSTTYGNSWIEKNNLIGNVTVYKIEASDSNKVYIGTSGSGLCVTSDIGSHWNKITSLHTDFIFDIAVGSNGKLFAASYDGLFISTDEGISWNLSDSSLTDWVEVMENENIIAANHSSIYISSDNGSTWENITNNLPQGSIRDLIVTNLNNYIYVSVFAKGVFRSTNMGSTWTAINNGLNFPFVDCLFSSSDGNLYAGTTQDIYLSTDFGEFWFSIKTPGLTNSWIQSIVTNSSGDIFAGTFGGGIYFSSDTGNNWDVKNQGLNRAVIRKLLVEDDLMFSAAYGAGIFRSSDIGKTWEKVNGSISSLYIYTIFRHIDGSLFAGTFGGTYKSTDNGDTWTFSGSLSPSTFASNSSGNIFAGHQGNGVYRSTDSGITWENINNGITYLSIQQLEVNSNDDVFACYPDSLLYRSTDNGNNWMLVNNGLNGDLWSIAHDNSDNLFVSSESGFFWSTNNGDSWTQMGVLNRFSEIKIIPGLGIYGVKFEGVFFSDDNGVNWSQVGEQTENLFCNTIGIKSIKSLFLGTEGSGLYKIDIISFAENESSETVKNFKLFQNYPNPFNPSTKIKFTIPALETRHASSLQMVTLKVYDILGNEVATLVNEEFPAGEYEVNFDASSGIGNLVSGIYFYKLKAGNFIQTKKMIYLK